LRNLFVVVADGISKVPYFKIMFYKIKVKQSLYRPGKAVGALGG
jgi:hypothetical protein